MVGSVSLLISTGNEGFATCHAAAQFDAMAKTVMIGPQRPTDHSNGADGVVYDTATVIVPSSPIARWFPIVQ